MAKLNWTPWMGLSDIKAELEQAMADAARSGRAPERMRGKAYLWTPAADVLETARDYVLTVELPGVARENVAVEVKHRTLWIYGERRFAKLREDDGVYHALERSYGPFARRFVLPKGVDRAAVKAVFKEGLLEITVPKERPEESRRRIEIS